MLEARALAPDALPSLRSLQASERSILVSRSLAINWRQPFQGRSSRGRSTLAGPPKARRRRSCARCRAKCPRKDRPGDDALDVLANSRVVQTQAAPARCQAGSPLAADYAGRSRCFRGATGCCRSPCAAAASKFRIFPALLVSVVEAAKDKPCFGQHRLTACRLAVRNKPFGVDCQIVFRQVDDLFNIAIFLLRRNYARVGDNIVDILSPHGGRKSEITDLKRRGPVAKNTSPVFAHISIEID